VQPIQTKFGICGHVKGWQRSGNFGHDQPILGKIGAGTSPQSQSFFVVIQRTFCQLRNGRFSPNFVTKRSSVSCHGIRKDIFENFHFRGHLPQNLKSKIGQTGISLTAGRYCLLQVVVQRPGSFRGRSTFLYNIRLQSYGATKSPNFRILAYFPYIKPLKSTFRWPAYRPGVTLQNDSDFSMW